MYTFMQGDYMEINKRMFDIMNEKNIKMSDLARHLEINKTVVSAWKSRGSNPPIEYAEQICGLLEISLEKLITGNDGEINKEETEILKAYRTASPAIKEATRKLLDVSETEQERSSVSRTG